MRARAKQAWQAWQAWHDAGARPDHGRGSGAGALWRATPSSAATPRPALSDTPVIAGSGSVAGSAHDTGERPAEASVPRGVRVAAAWSWRMIVIVAAVIGAFYLLGYVSTVAIPAIIALLLTAFLQPGANWLHRLGVPRSLAALIMLVTGMVVVAGVLTGVVTAFVNGLPDLSRNVAAGLIKIQHWLHNGPFHISDQQLNGVVAQGEAWLSSHRSALTAGALSTATTVGEVVVDLFLILFTTFFLVRDGRGIWNFLIQLLLPRAARPVVDDAGSASWRTLVSYVRATVLVAFIDAVCIGIGIVAVGVPPGLALPLAALVFLGAFIPIVGATVSGVVAVLVTLVTQGLLGAIIVLIVVLGVQQIEGHLLQPLIMGRAVAVHPLGVILGITAGIAVAGIFGGLIAVPTIAVVNTAIRRVVARQRHAPPPAPGPETPPGPPTTLPPPQSDDAGREPPSDSPGAEQPSS